MCFAMNRKEYLIGSLNVGFYPTSDLQIEDVSPVSEDNPLLSLIFSKDERGCFVGDLSQYLSPKTNAEVKMFIQQQLMQENHLEKGLSLSESAVNEMRQVISDDDISRFSRNHGESPEQYAYRLGKYFADEKSKNVSNARFEREKSRLESLGFNFD